MTASVRDLLQFGYRCLGFVHVVKLSVIFTFQTKAMFISIVHDITYVSKERDDLWYATTQPLDCGCVAAKDKVSRIIAHNIQLTRSSVSLHSSASSVLADTGASIGSHRFRQVHSHFQH